MFNENTQILRMGNGQNPAGLAGGFCQYSLWNQTIFGAPHPPHSQLGLISVWSTIPSPRRSHGSSKDLVEAFWELPAVRLSNSLPELRFGLYLGLSVVPFYPFLGDPYSKIDYRKKGALILTSLLEDLVTLSGLGPV